MVLPHFFSKDKSYPKVHPEKGKSKGKEKEKEKDKDKEKHKYRSSSSCHADISPSSSSSSLRPQKSSSSSKSSRSHPHSRSSSSTTSSSRFSFPSSRHSRDRDTHPLNLPPDELRRLSAMAAVRDDQRSSMDIDKDVQSPSNGVNGVQEERSPTPPPHRSSPGSTTTDADSFKLAGNKFFKDGDYSRAIQEYNKGWRLNIVSMSK